MAIRILYYSFTGHTRDACQRLADSLGAELDTITAPAPRRGVWAMVVLGARSLFGLGPEISVPARDWAAADLLILAAPVWAGRVALPMRQWLRQAPDLPARIALVVSSGAPALPEGLAAEFTAATGREAAALLHLSQADLENGADSEKIASFAESCRAITARPLAKRA
ncbi:hypothetical protein [Pseudooceanicola sp.]|uniref:hypothetical protein n=1 Tax=Pseudooceanicola sp. TaxID=1914328 RepID=UPI00262D683B|nr:hypothetical protein [Pseudooceanicola sp.]MDF1853831.1 hypothetical protein [Pseudooceanicola sp.]